MAQATSELTGQGLEFEQVFCQDPRLSESSLHVALQKIHIEHGISREGHFSAIEIRKNKEIQEI